MRLAGDRHRGTPEHGGLPRWLEEGEDSGVVLTGVEIRRRGTGFEPREKSWMPGWGVIVAHRRDPQRQRWGLDKDTNLTKRIYKAWKAR
jgi:hypothetical protein